MRPLVVVAAIARNGVIGRDNDLPWRLKTDLRRFRALTWGKPLIMGRRNWDSIGRPLPGRETVVLSRDPDFAPPGATIARDWADATRLADGLAERLGADEVAVVGGAEIYRLALPEAARLRLTLVEARPPGDVLFPAYDETAFVPVAREEHGPGPDDEHAFTFVDLERRAGDPAP